MPIKSILTESRLTKLSSLTDKQLYRSILRQAKLLSIIFQDPILFISHSYLARLNFAFAANPTVGKHLQSSSIVTRQMRESNLRKKKQKLSDEDKEFQSLGFETSIDVREQRKRIRTQQHLRSLSSANLGYSHCVDRCIEQAYGRRGKIRHELLASFEPRRPLPRPQPSKARLDHPLIFPSLRLLLLSQAAKVSKSSRILPSYIDYPPINFLPVPYEADPQRQALGPDKRISKRREANARWKWVETVFERVRGPLCLREEVVDGRSLAKYSQEKPHRSNVPIVQKDAKTLELNSERIFHDHDLVIEHLEALASNSFPISGSRECYDLILESTACIRALKEAAEFGTPRHVSASSLPSTTTSYYNGPSASPRLSDLKPDREGMEFFEYKPSVPKKLRGEGWKFSPIDFTKDGRARRRRYRTLLSSIPILKRTHSAHEIENKYGTSTEQASTALNADPTSTASSTSILLPPAEATSRPLSPFSPLITPRYSLLYNSSKSPFDTAYLAELIDRVNIPEAPAVRAQPSSTSTSKPSKITTVKTSQRAPSKSRSSKVEFVYSMQVLHPSGSTEAQKFLAAKKEELWVNQEDVGILFQDHHADV